MTTKAGMTKARLLVPVLSSLVLALAPAAASAQVNDQHARIGAHLALGFGGSSELSGDSSIGSGSGEGDLEPTVGFGLRGEVPVIEYLSIGGLFEALSIEAENSDRNWQFNFDVLLRARYVFEAVRGELFIEPYFALPVGFSMSYYADLGTIDPDDQTMWPGWNIATMLGVTVFSSMGLGGFVELGWRHSDVFTSVDVPVVGDIDLQLSINELALNFGAVFLL